MSCKVNKQTIEDFVIRKSIDNDSDVVISDSVITFTSKEAYDKTVQEIRELEDKKMLSDEIGPIIMTDDGNMSIEVIENEDLIGLYNQENNRVLRTDIPAESAPKFKTNVVNNEYIEVWRRKLSKNLRVINEEIRKINNALNDKKLSEREAEAMRINDLGTLEKINEEREELYRQQALLIKLKNKTKEQIEKMGNYSLATAVDEMIDIIQIGIDTLSYLLSDDQINTLTVEQIGVIRHIMQSNEYIIKECFSKNNSVNARVKISENFMIGPDVNLNSDQTARINEQHAQFNTLKEKYNQYLADKQMQYIRTNGLLAQKFGIDFMTETYMEGREGIKMKNFKTLFGGVEMSDKGFLEYLGLNIDRSFSSESALEQLLQMELDDKTMEYQQWAYNMSQRLVELGKKLKKHGINIETQKGSEFLREKDEHGKETGRLANVFSTKFMKKIWEFRKIQGSERKDFMKRVEFIKDNFDAIDITRLSDLVDDENIRMMMEALSRNRNIQFTSDARYTEDIKKKFGPCYEETVLSIKNAIRNNFIARMEYEQSGVIDEEQAKQIYNTNPVEMILKILDIQKRGSVNELDYLGGDPGNEYLLYFDKLKCGLIPKDDNDYNLSFRRNFCGNDSLSKTKAELYKTFSELYSTVNALYFNNPNDKRYAKISTDFIDKFDDAKNFPDKLKALLYMAYESCKEHLYNDHFYHTDEDAVSKNYMDIQKEKEQMFLNMLNSGLSNAEIDKLSKEVEIERKNYKNDDEYKRAIAKEHSMHCFSTNMLKSATNIAYLYAAQKARESMYETARLIEAQYNTYLLNGKEGGRETANKQMHNYIQRVIQKIELKTNETILDKKIKDVIFLRTLVEKTSESSVIKKILEKTLKMKMDDEEKRVYNEFKKLAEGFDKTKKFEFRYKGRTYKYDPTANGVDKYQMKTSSNAEFKSLGEHGDALFERDFNNYLSDKMKTIGSDITFGGIVELVQSLIIFKALAGISTSGIFNRIEGHLAAAEADASGYYWSPGNLARAERLFFGAGMHRYVNENGDPKFFPDSKGAKRRRILQIFADRSSIFQDMKNQFDKTIDTSPGTTMSHNLDLYQLSVTNPEFKNQMTMCVACMFDLKVQDNNGNWHPFIDENGEFTLYDLKDGKLVLKKGFEKYNQEWVNFDVIKDKITTMTTENGVERIVKNTRTTLGLFVAKQKWMISTIQGDYRKTSCVGYTNSAMLRQIMTLKRWYPAKVYRAWNPGKGVNIAMETVDKEGNVKSVEEGGRARKTQSGKYYDMTMYGGVFMTCLPAILSLEKLDKGVVKSAANIGLGLFMVVKTIKNRLGTDKIENNVSLLQADLEFLKSTLFEFVYFLPRAVFKRDSMFDTKSNEIGFQNQEMVRKFGEMRLKAEGLTKESFETEEDYENALSQYANIIVGNFRSVAREVGTRAAIICIALIAKAILWDPEDGDDDDRRQFYNWVDNNVNKVLQSTNDCMYMLNSLQDKYSVDSIPLIRWVNDIDNFVKALNKGEMDKVAKYGLRSIPLPRGIIYEGHLTFSPSHFTWWDPFDIFKSGYEYNKDEWTDYVAKNMKTHGQYGYERQYKKYREEAVNAYMKKFKKKTFSPNEISEIKEYMERNNYEEKDIYKLDDKKMKTIIRNAFLPNKSKKPFQKMSDKQMVEEYKKFFDEKDLSYNWFRLYYRNPSGFGLWESYDKNEE